MVVPVTATLPDLIQNGWPAAFTLNVYVNPLTKVNTGLEPVTAPLNPYAAAPMFITLNIVSIELSGTS